MSIRRHRSRAVAIVLVAAISLLVAGLTSSLHAPRAYADTDPVIAAAGDIACDPTNGGFNGGNGTPTDCRQKYTAALLVGADKVLTLGDNQYACGGTAAFQQSYDPSWGQVKSITAPAPGNHEYQTSGGTDCSTNAAGYFGYFGAAAGDPAKGYYSFDLGAWHLISLNGECSQIGGCAAGAPQEVWLRNDLAANASASCTLAYWHEPRFASTRGGGDGTYAAFWQALYAAHADVVLNGHQHWYERFALQNPSGQADPNGIREFIVGTGGESYVAPSSAAVNSQVLHSGTFGVLKMTLHPGSYDWTFVPDTGSIGGSFSDSGSTACHNGPPGADVTPPTTTVSCNGSACSSSWYKSAATVTLSASDGAGGSGVDRTYYTTDGSTPTTTSPVYVSGFSVPETTTVRFFSTDLVGNAEQSRSQLILVDGAPPSVALTAPASGTSVKKGAKLSLAASADDIGTGAGAPSGVARVQFYLDGSKLLGTDTSAPYGITWSTGSGSRGTHTLTAVANDLAGNSATSASVAVTLR